MLIGGFQKLTLLDYPDHLAALVFTCGCNLRCPFCHNATLVKPNPSMTMVEPKEVLDYLRKRQGILDGVVISGGEPLLQHDLSSFLQSIKALGYSVKLDTNGSFPDRLKGLIDEQLVDYVAVDIKQCKSHYGQAIGFDGASITDRIDETMVILESSFPHEYRTTIVNGIHTLDDIEQIIHWIPHDANYYLQSYVDSGSILDPTGLSSLDPTTFHQWYDHIHAYRANTFYRL